MRGWTWKLLESAEQPASAQVELGGLEQQQKQAEQGGHLEQPRDAARESGEAECRETHGAAASGLLTGPCYRCVLWDDCPPTCGREKGEGRT